jgi:ABC-type polysaccharide/polyol phosphate export permease
MFIGYIFKSEETTILASISIASLLIFFSNAILPVETISGKLRLIANYNPLYVTDSLLKKTILFNSPLYNLINEFIILGVVLFIFLTLAFIARKMTKRLL